MVLQSICTGPISSWFIHVSTRDVLVGLFDVVTINVPWTLYLRCLCSDLLFWRNFWLFQPMWVPI